MMSFQLQRTLSRSPRPGSPDGVREAICTGLGRGSFLLEFVRLIEALSLYHP